LKHSSDGIVIASIDGRIEWMNDSAEVLSGYPLSTLLAQRASVNVFVPLEKVSTHEGYLQHFKAKRMAQSSSMRASSHDIAVAARRLEMRTSYGTHEIQLRVEVAHDKLIGFLKSTKEFIPREDFETERLKWLLPASIVKLLRSDPTREITSHYWEFENTTILFTDVKGFSTWAKTRGVKAVHDRMQPMFSEFEKIIQAFGGELIHRIGDAVMAIFGFNGESKHHARFGLACAIELQRWALGNDFLIRVGLNSGPIGAGVYGCAAVRPAFDAWGPNVNMTKRLEEHGVPGSIHLSKAVTAALGHRFRSTANQFLKPHMLSGAKGVPDMETLLLQVKADDSDQVVLDDKITQAVNFLRAQFARWKIQTEETERRLLEIQKASRN
jgi:class 3 adenylate cyclase